MKACCSSLRDRLHALASLRHPVDFLVLVQVLFIAPVVPLLMRLPLPRIARILNRMTMPVPPSLTPERLAFVVDTAPRVARPLVRPGCLTRGVSLFMLLKPRSSLGTLRLCFGMGGAADGYSGHCWLEVDGEPFLERVDPRERFPEQFAVVAGSQA